ncbi:unnamed protein product [Paramecium pentaurelia]|uniref:Uncharacterized protein n=1 Tax=Paramecium pentaurelia TaxID=43138 RepID=A0A8S1XU83_9CILI|nr:unnamed protein product [Paramecium pentaurelia]
MADSRQQNPGPYDPCSVPKGGLNQQERIILPLKFICPSDCVCQSKVERIWHHKKCGNPSFITDYGDILCKNHLTDCPGYFIKDASFQCNKAAESNTWYQHKSMSQLFDALSKAIQVAENDLSDDKVIQFSKNLINQLQTRWYT